MTLGERGPTGDHGQEGTPGRSGERGVTGIQGRTGATGPKGEDGGLSARQVALILIFVTIISTILLIRSEVNRNFIHENETELRLQCMHTNDVAQRAGYADLIRQC